jgi:superoxide dismutase, Cu-Zn family
VSTLVPIHSYELPGDAVFPESVGVDPASGDAYVGSMGDGTLYRLGDDGEVTVFSPAGTDGRTSVAGVKIDARRRLWAAGGYDGTIYAYDVHSGGLLARFDVRIRPSCVNDFTFGPSGETYVTDSFIPKLFRVGGDPLALEPWVDLVEQGVPWPDGLNLNGIVLTPDRRHVVACQTNLGRFWRVGLDTGRLSEVELDGGPLEHCDGLALVGSTLYVAVNARDQIAVVELADDGSRGSVVATLRSEAFAFPTSVAVRRAELLVVNGQLDRFGGTPQLPFTVVAVERPG